MKIKSNSFQSFKVQVSKCYALIIMLTMKNKKRQNERLIKTLKRVISNTLYNKSKYYVIWKLKLQYVNKLAIVLAGIGTNPIFLLDNCKSFANFPLAGSWLTLFAKYISIDITRSLILPKAPLINFNKGVTPRFEGTMTDATFVLLVLIFMVNLNKYFFYVFHNP